MLTAQAFHMSNGAHKGSQMSFAGCLHITHKTTLHTHALALVSVISILAVAVIKLGTLQSRLRMMIKNQLPSVASKLRNKYTRSLLIEALIFDIGCVQAEQKGSTFHEHPSLGNLINRNSDSQDQRTDRTVSCTLAFAVSRGTPQYG